MDAINSWKNLENTQYLNKNFNICEKNQKISLNELFKISLAKIKNNPEHLEFIETKDLIAAGKIIEKRFEMAHNECSFITKQHFENLYFFQSGLLYNYDKLSNLLAKECSI